MRTYLDTTQLIDITGITDDPITTLGSVEAVLRNEEFEVDFPFHVVPDYFHIPSDGIIGKDFMKRFRCNIDYDSMMFSFYLDNSLVSIPIMEGPTDDTIVLPARSEVMRQFTLENRIDQPMLVTPQEVKPGVFIARTMINSSKPLLTVLNTTERVVVLKNSYVEVEEVSDYDVFEVDKIENNERRTEILTEILKERTPERCRDELLPLCQE